jgi:hypothetical protein
MRIVALGDTHGRVIWKDIVDKEIIAADKIIFIGDYFDTHGGGVSGNKQIVNFKELLQLKREYPDKIVLLFGNHDFHYIRGIGETYSGYQAGYAVDIGAAIGDAITEGLVQMCYKHDKFVFTHAGVTMTWCVDNEIDMTDLETSINDMFKYKPAAFKFTMGGNFSNTGDDVTQPPIWVRPLSLLHDMVGGITCVVGHTTVKEIGISERLILIDTLGISEEYLIINDGVPEKGKLIRK